MDNDAKVIEKWIADAEAKLERLDLERATVIDDIELFQRALEARLRMSETDPLGGTLAPPKPIAHNGNFPKTFSSKSAAVLELVRTNPGLTKRELIRLIKTSGIKMKDSYAYDILIRFEARGLLSVDGNRYYVAQSEGSE